MTVRESGCKHHEVIINYSNYNSTECNRTDVKTRRQIGWNAVRDRRRTNSRERRKLTTFWRVRLCLFTLFYNLYIVPLPRKSQPHLGRKFVGRPIAIYDNIIYDIINQFISLLVACGITKHVAREDHEWMPAVRNFLLKNYTRIHHCRLISANTVLLRTLWLQLLLIWQAKCRKCLTTRSHFMFHWHKILATCLLVSFIVCISCDHFHRTCKKAEPPKTRWRNKLSCRHRKGATAIATGTCLSDSVMYI